MGDERSDFEKWFVEQHGERPSNKSEDELDGDMAVAEQTFLRARNLLQQVRGWEARRTSALYAWSARRDYK